MKRNKLILMVSICILMVTLSCATVGGKAVSPTVDIEIGIRNDDVSILTIDYIIYNSNQQEASLTDSEFYVHLDGEQKEALRGLSGITIKPMKSVTIDRDCSIPGGVPTRHFLRKGFNVTVNGTLSFDVNSDSFEVPFEKTTAVYLKPEEGEAKLAISPCINNIELKTSKVLSPSEELTDIIINMSTIIKNPNPVNVSLEDFYYGVYFKKDGKWVRLFSGGCGAPTINPRESITISTEWRESDDEVIQHLMSGSPIDMKVRGLMSTFPKEKGWSPTYFESPFEMIITTINGSGVSEEVTSTPTPPMATTEPLPTLAAGYKWYHDDEFNYAISYPEGWEEVFSLSLGEGLEGGVQFQEYNTPNIIMVLIASEYDIERLKAMGGKEVVINDRKGYEVIIRPMPTVKQRIVAFEVDDKYYVISCSTAEDLYDKYADAFDTAINSFIVTISPTPTPIPGFEVISAIVGLFAVAYLWRRRK